MTEREHKILIAGDLAPISRPGKLLVEGEIRAVFGGILPVIQSADCFLANLECPLTDSTNQLSKPGTKLKADPRAASALKAAGISVVSLANNHIFDYGLDGLKQTQSVLENHSIQWYGVGENAERAKVPLFMDLDGLRLGLLAYAEHEFNWQGDDRWCTSMLEPAENVLQIQAVAGQCDALIVLLHAGCENWHYPSPRVVKLCRAYAEAGASAVLVSHSHTVMGAERYKGVPIVYGLGNFLFDRAHKPVGWRLGCIAQLTLRAGRVRDLEVLPIYADHTTGCIDLVQGSARARFEQFHRRISEPLKQMDELGELWKCFCAAESSKFAKEIFKALVAMLPGACLRICRLGKTSVREDSYYRKGASILRGFSVCENHNNVLSQISELLREDRLREYRAKAREVIKTVNNACIGLGNPTSLE